ncbi:hypothetical protein L345_01254, partial [Ophiophagus hannah]
MLSPLCPRGLKETLPEESPIPFPTLALPVKWNRATTTRPVGATPPETGLQVTISTKFRIAFNSGYVEASEFIH